MRLLYNKIGQKRKLFSRAHTHTTLSAEHEGTKSKDVTPAVSLTTPSHLAPVYLLLTQYISCQSVNRFTGLTVRFA